MTFHHGILYFIAPNRASVVALQTGIAKHRVTTCGLDSSQYLTNIAKLDVYCTITIDGEGSSLTCLGHLGLELRSQSMFTMDIAFVLPQAKPSVMLLSVKIMVHNSQKWSKCCTRGETRSYYLVANTGKHKL